MHEGTDRRDEGNNSFAQFSISDDNYKKYLFVLHGRRHSLNRVGYTKTDFVSAFRRVPDNRYVY